MTLDQLSAAATDGELLPCPFCGCSITLTTRTERDGYMGDRTFYVPSGKHTGLGGHCSGQDVRGSASVEAATTRWNIRTGQLVAVADDAIERVARTLAPNLEGGREFDQMPKDRAQLRQWTAQGMCLINDATQDDATWLAQEAIKAAKGTGDE